MAIYGLSIVLWVASVSLLAGSLIGIYGRSRLSKEEHASPMSESKPEVEPSKPVREKRRARRARTDSRLDMFDAEGRFLAGHTRLVDFSPEGARLVSSVPLSRGQKIRGRMKVKMGYIQIKGCIVWHRSDPPNHVYGVKFETLERIRWENPAQHIRKAA